jgi:DNA modification methylase
MDGWWLRSDIIWAKPNPMPESVRDRPTDMYEHILMLTKSARYYWNAEAVSEPVKDSTLKRLGQPNLAQQHGSDRMPGKTNGPMKAVPPRFGGNKYGDSDIEEYRTKSGNDYGGGNGCRNLRNVWTFSTQPYKGAHFATFPTELVIRCLQAATKQGDLVLDPFGGSGTVGEVAFNMQRRFFLMDLAYQNLQRERIPPMAFTGFRVESESEQAVKP